MFNRWRNDNPETRRQEDEFDLKVDAALAKFTAARPRAGLEDRILANLRADQAQVPERFWWCLYVAGALVAIAMVALALAWRSGKPSPAVVANHSPATSHALKELATPIVASGLFASNSHANQRLHAFHSTRRRSMNPVPREPIVVVNPRLDEPKLDQFPSPQPLSEQEKILQSYVAEYPKKAVLIARATSEALQHDLEEMKMKTFASDQQHADSEEQHGDRSER
jgi:hypothetical protein